jgi:hypothetical protein
LGHQTLGRGSFTSALPAQHQLGLRHDRGELAVAARHPGLPHHRAAAAVQHLARAVSSTGMPAKKLVLLSTVASRLPSPPIPRVRDGGRVGAYATTKKSWLVSANPGLSVANWMAAAAPVPSLS